MRKRPRSFFYAAKKQIEIKSLNLCVKTSVIKPDPMRSRGFKYRNKKVTIGLYNGLQKTGLFSGF